MRRTARRLALFCWTLLLGSAAAQTLPTPSDTDPKARPRLGLVLSGGGARGLAHVGVLKVLERERIPVDLIAGTSMGAIIGGLYASGMTAADLERELLPLAWDRVFASRVERQHLSQRRKEEDFEFSAVMELGMRDGELRAPQGTLSSRGLEILLRRYTQPVRSIEQFDALPTPFRAISTDMESGTQVVLDQGDLALAMRSSMSVPGVFAPVETRGRILGDGGLVNNLPVDVARRMGAQRLIAVNVGTPLAGRETLSSLVGVTAQMINILTEQNVQRSVASLWSEDVLISPELGKLGSGDFERSREMIEQGARAAEAMVERLRPLALSPDEYAQWQLARTPQAAPSAQLAAIAFEGSELAHPERFVAQLETKPGQSYDAARAERDARLLASSGDYERVDYHIEPRPEGDTLVFAMEDKYWGPNYFRVGLDLSTDFSGESAFNLRISHNRHWLTPHGTEWRNQLTLGQTPRLYSEIYHPLIAKLGSSNDWFLSGWGELERRSITIYDEDSGRSLARLGRQGATVGIDLGQPWGQWGEIRLGLIHQRWHINPDLVTEEARDGVMNQTWHESGLRIKAVIDQLDFANFPQRGYRLAAKLTGGQQAGPDVSNAYFQRIELEATGARSWRTHTLNLHARIFDAKQREDSTQGPYALGGFQQLSGYEPNQLIGDTLAFARLTYYKRLREIPVLTRGFFVGGSLEAGNAWDNRHQASLKDLRYAASLFVGTDSGLGPLYLGIGHAPRGSTALYLFIGRP
jgi:NTE family protein